MILYDNNKKLSGISSDALTLLGYEDIDDFKKYVSDIAQLFIKKTGYIHKYDNFSWIDYVLHSGAAKKNAFMRLKNGQQIEVEVFIKELYLTKNIGEVEYAIKLRRASKHEKMLEQEEIIEEKKSSIASEDEAKIKSFHTREQAKEKIENLAHIFKIEAPIEEKDDKKINNEDGFRAKNVLKTSKEFKHQEIKQEGFVLEKKEVIEKDIYIKDASQDDLEFLNSYALPKEVM